MSTSDGRPRVLVAPDKFKGTFSAREACDHLARGIREAAPSVEVVCQPMADGGEGTMDVLLEGVGGERIRLASRGPFDSPVKAMGARLADGTALIESAAFLGARAEKSGRRDPLSASSFGLGRGVSQALSWAPAFLMIGLGGTLTMDGGLGLARALGFSIRDAEGRSLEGRGSDLAALHAIEPPPRPFNPGRIPIVGLADVESPLCGPRGAARTFAPQKGAGPEAMRALESGLEGLARILERSLGVVVGEVSGSGAAGGLGAGVVAFLEGKLVPGSTAVAEMVDLDGKMEGADLVVTGEGAYDGRHPGKACEWICRKAASRGVPVIVICGRARGDLPQGDVEFTVSGGEMGADTLIEAGKTLARRRFSRD